MPQGHMPCFAPYAFGSAPTLPPHSKNPGAAHALAETELTRS